MSDTTRERGFQLVGDATDETPDAAERPRSERATFGAFVLSLTTSALYHLGVAPEEGLRLPELGEPRIDLALGQQTIEILEMIREKTRGNLDPDELRLIEQALHDLHMQFVEVKRRHT
jgi:hypothetical protein